MSVIDLTCAEELSVMHVRALASGQAAAIRVPSFIDDGVARAMASWMTATAADDYFVVADRGRGPERFPVGVKRIGCPLSELAGSPDLGTALESYRRTAEEVRAAMTAACDPSPTPVESLIALIERVWPSGAVAARLGGCDLSPGIARIVEPDATMLETQPHVDAVHPSAFGLDAQISANVYLEVPAVGGELEVWPDVLLSVEDLFAPSVVDRLQRARLGQSHAIAPRRLELIVINSRRPHAVRTFRHGRRLSVQCFIGVPADGSPLVLWS